MAHPLNPAQLQAVEHYAGPVVVLAGAGSGKTRVITHRIARLLERGVPASAILALTFTNKAAGEMALRVSKLLGKGLAGKGERGSGSKGAVTITTFHSFGLEVLRREQRATGPFTIFDQGDSLAAVKEILRTVDVGKRFDAAVILERISRAKNAFQDVQELPDHDADAYDAITRLVYPRYEAALRGFRAYDFDDLVCGVVSLWHKRPDVLARWRERYRFLLVDEYQDTNGAQLALVQLLAEEHRNVCVVGDDDQAIYGWRGADVKNLLQFEDHFPGAAVIKLEQNYRSVSPILAVANAVIARRTDVRHPKVLFTDKKGGERVRSVVAPTPEVEASWIAGEIARLVRDQGKSAQEICVLYRSNGQAKAFEEALRERGVAHRVIGGQQFFERKEVKDILAYLRVVVNPNDEIALRRVVNYPARGIGETSVERLGVHAVAKGWTLWQAIERVDALDDVSGAAREGCKDLERVVSTTRSELSRAPSVEAAVRDLCHRIGLKRDIEQCSPSLPAAARRWGNVEGLFASFARREARERQAGWVAAEAGKPPAWLGAFLQALTLETHDDDAETPSGRVTLSSLHGAKGLEFDFVFLAGCEEGLLPHSRTLDARATDSSPQDLDEERRLFYVGVTRARESLVLTRAKARATRGRTVARTPSRFVLEIPAGLVDEIQVTEDPAVKAVALEQGASALLAALEALGR
jgi:DNA helicase-2/ATP-dependent DNA helicase PcrA